MSRSLRVTIKYFTFGGLMWLVAMTIRPFLHYLEERMGEFPFWVWEIEYPICSLLVIAIIVFWGYQTYQRIIQKAQRRMFCAICYCSASWIAISCAENAFFSAEVPIIMMIRRHLWYFTLMPWMMIPLLFLLIALYIGKSDKEKIDRRYLLLWIPFGLINLGLLTNDLHRQAFHFPDGIDHWRTSAIYGWIFYIAYAWIFIFSLAAIIVIYRRTKVRSSRKFCIFPLISLGIGQLLAWAVYRNMFYLRIADVCIFIFGITLELCIRLNLIPSNVHYPDLIKCPEFQVYIYDDELRLTSKPDGAEDIPAGDTPYMLDEYHRVNSSKVFGGYVYWIEDETKVHHLRAEMKEVRELLKEESSLIREENELKKRKITVSIKRQLYDSISEFSAPLIRQMEEELDSISLDKDPRQLAHLCIQMAYLKRRSNMILKQQENGMLPLEELYNAVYEPFSYMDYLNIYAYPSGRLQGYEDGDRIIALYDMFYECMMAAYSNLSAILVNFSETTSKVMLSMMMSVREDINAEHSRELMGTMGENQDPESEIQVSSSYDDEEKTIYIMLTMQKGDSVC